MSTDTLAAHQILSKRFSYPAACDWYVPVVESMEEYAAAQVDQQTKRLKEERDKAINLLRRMIASCDGYPEVLEGCTLELDINNFFTELNQNNEG